MAAPPQARQQQDVYRPPVVSLMYCVGMFAASYWMHRHGGHVSELWKLGSLAMIPLALLQLKKAIDDRFSEFGTKVKIDKLNELAKVFGESRWATWQDIEECEHLSETEGRLVGTVQDEQGRERDLRLKGDFNLSETAPPGSLKTMALITTAIFGGLSRFICNDPSGEALKITYDFLKMNNFKIIISFQLSPCIP